MKYVKILFKLLKMELTNLLQLMTISQKQRKLVKKPWLTKGIWTSIKNKQKLYKMWFLEKNTYERRLY